VKLSKQFLSNPVCRMSYVVWCRIHVKYRMSYVIPILCRVHMPYEVLYMFVDTYVSMLHVATLLSLRSLCRGAGSSSVVLFRLGLPDTRIPIRGHIALPRIRIAYRLVYYLVGLWKGQATARSFLPKKWLFLTLRFTF
jgi:hypothetical protein